jgi:signal transduction histidine kinase
MTLKARNSFNLLSSGNIAFVLVVCASYASATAALIYSRRRVPSWEIVALILIAALYLVLGTYGFAIFRRYESRVWRLAYFVVQLLLAGALILMRSAGELSLILLPLAGQSALLLSTHLMVPVCALIYLTLVMPLLLRSRWIDAIAIAIVYGVGIVFVVVFTRVAARERTARKDLTEANQRLRKHAAQIEDLAITKERNRLAREIHDSVGHYLTVVNVQIGAAQAILAHDQIRALDHLTKAQTLTQEGLAEIRRSVAALRSPNMESRPLAEALEQLVEQWNAGGRQARLRMIGSERALIPQAELTLYRTAQEALTNVDKHANATRVDLLLDYSENDSVRLKVEDYGGGTDNVRTGFGLSGIRERVQLLGGDVQVRTSIGKGFTLEVRLPR